MEMVSKKRALDKIYKRRDRYEIPDWQREEVWPTAKKQALIDTILRGWKLPKFYFAKTSDDPEEFEVVDGQQRLTAIFEFFDNALGLSPLAAKHFKGQHYKDLPPHFSDAFDDFEIEYDEITDASDKELKDFFQRLQQGLPLRSSEKLNALESALRNFCRKLAGHDFFKASVNFADKRYAYFDVVAKSAAIEIEGLETGLRFDDLKELFEAQQTFSAKSTAAKRLSATLDFLLKAFPKKKAFLRNRSVVQSLITLASKIVATGKGGKSEKLFAEFAEKFMGELARQVDLGLNATDPDYIEFQRSVNANVKNGAKTRHTILMRKMFQYDPNLANIFEPDALTEAGLSGQARTVGERVAEELERVNEGYSAKNGHDLFKPTNKTAGAIRRIQKPISNYSGYKELISDLYFLFWEGPGERLKPNPPDAFKDINMLRTDLQHDVDHGKAGKVAAKRKDISATFKKYGGGATPKTLAPEQFVVVQLNLLAAVDQELRLLTASLEK